jgi:energy-coupling factor transporter transmembrane protein EcfT
VFEESRNLCLGLASRGISWQSLGASGTLGLVASVISRLFSNLMIRADSIAVAMTARGFLGPERHALYLPAAPRGTRGAAADAAVLLSLAGLCALCYVLN